MTLNFIEVELYVILNSTEVGSEVWRQSTEKEIALQWNKVSQGHF